MKCETCAAKNVPRQERVAVVRIRRDGDTGHWMCQACFEKWQGMFGQYVMTVEEYDRRRRRYAAA